MSNTNQKPTNWLMDSLLNFLDHFNLLSFFRFLNLGNSIMREEKNKLATWSFALLYAFEVASYITFVLCIPDDIGNYTPFVKVNYPIALFSGTMLGGIAASLLIAVLNWSVKDLLRYSTWIYLAGTVLHLCVNLVETFGLAAPERDSTYELFIFSSGVVRLFSYFVFGFGFASSIGLIVSQIVEKLPRFNRSFTIAFVHGFAFLSPVIIASVFLCYGENNANSKLVALSIAAGLAIFSIFTAYGIPEDALFRSRKKHNFATWLGWLGLSPSLSERDSEMDARYFWLSALTGCNMLFFFYLFTNIDKICFVEPEKIKNYDVIFWGYLGLAIGSLYWSWRAKVTGSRRKNIIYSNLLQLALLCSFVYTLAYSSPYKANEFKGCILLLGFCCSWALILGQAAEQFMTKNRASLMSLLPNLFRFAPLFLAFATKAEQGNLPEEALKIIAKHNNITILVAAILLLLISTIATLSVDNLFGSEPNILDRKRKSIASSELRGAINKLGSKRYLHHVNELLSRHFAETLKSQYYLSTFYYINNDKEKRLKSTEFTSETVVFDNGIRVENNLIDKRTFEQRNKKEFQDVNRIAWVHIVGDSLIEKKHLKSISRWIAEDDKYNGLLVWRSGPSHNVLRDQENPNRNRQEGDVSTMVLNLSDIVFKDNTIVFFPENFDNEAWSKDKTKMEEKWLEKIIELRENADFQGSMTLFLSLPQFKDEQEEVKNSLIHFYMDAMMYPRGAYYRYWIRPYKRVDKVLAILMLKTSSFLSKAKLGQLRDLLTMIVMQKAIIKLDNNYKEIDSMNKQIRNSNSAVSAEYEHHRKYQLLSLQKNVDRFISSLDASAGFQEKKAYQMIDFQFKHLSDTADLFTHLLKSDKVNNKETLNRMKNKEDYLSTVPIKQMLDIQLDIIKNVVQNFEFNNKATADLLLGSWDKKTIPTLNIIDEDKKLTINKTVFNVIVHELLKNSATFAKADNPEVKLNFSKISEDTWQLQFINNHNNPMNSDTLKFINSEDFDIESEISAKRGGIRTIKRLIEAYEGNRIKLKAISGNDETIIMLQIPNDLIS
jgi:hypothetical protein